MFDSTESVKFSTQQLFLLDTLVSNNVFRGLFDALRESPLESFRWPVWSTERQPDFMVNNDVILTKKEVADICEKYKKELDARLEHRSKIIEQVER